MGVAIISGSPIAVAGETGQLATINCLVDFYLAN